MGQITAQFDWKCKVCRSFVTVIYYPFRPCRAGDAAAARDAAQLLALPCARIIRRQLAPSVDLAP